MKKQLLLFGVLLSVSVRLLAQKATIGSFFTSFDSTKIYYEIKGNGYPVILIHGFSGTGQGWKHCAVYNDLLKAGYMVVLIDQRG
ncbi:MAG: alpha/beta fold hydrolase, partial [Candidatus Saccharimonadales bacterium]